MLATWIQITTAACFIDWDIPVFTFIHPKELKPEFIEVCINQQLKTDEFICLPGHEWCPLDSNAAAAWNTS